LCWRPARLVAAAGHAPCLVGSLGWFGQAAGLRASSARSLAVLVCALTLVEPARMAAQPAWPVWEPARPVRLFQSNSNFFDRDLDTFFYRKLVGYDLELFSIGTGIYVCMYIYI
jgi:hypothetical protein